VDGASRSDRRSRKVADFEVDELHIGKFLGNCDVVAKECESGTIIKDFLEELKRDIPEKK